MRLCPLPSTPEPQPTSHRNSASTRRGSASSTARRSACRAALVTCGAGGGRATRAGKPPARTGRNLRWSIRHPLCKDPLCNHQAPTWPLKGPYTSSASCSSAAAPPLPSAAPGGRFTRASTCTATPHSGSSHSGPAAEAIWKPAATPDSTAYRRYSSCRPRGPSAASAAPLLPFAAAPAAASGPTSPPAMARLPSCEERSATAAVACVAAVASPALSPSRSAASGKPRGTARWRRCSTSSPSACCSAAASAVAAITASCCATVVGSAAERPDCCLPRLTTRSGGRENSDAGPASELPAGAASSRLGPTRFGPNIQARCSSGSSPSRCSPPVSCRRRWPSAARLSLPGTPVPPPTSAPACCCCCCSAAAPPRAVKASRSRPAFWSRAVATGAGSGSASTRSVHAPEGVVASAAYTGRALVSCGASSRQKTVSLQAHAGRQVGGSQRLHAAGLHLRSAVTAPAATPSPPHQAPRRA